MNKDTMTIIINMFNYLIYDDAKLNKFLELHDIDGEDFTSAYVDARKNIQKQLNTN